MDWNDILKEVISGSILLIIGGIGGWFGGFFKGKKKSSNAIKRKNEIYQPLIDEIEKYTNFKWSIRENIKTPFLNEIVTNSYKYHLTQELETQCIYLNETINKYNEIDILRIAHSIIVDIFEKGYTELYGSIYDGISNQCDRYGNEWEEHIIAEPVISIRHSDYLKEIDNLLFNEGMYSDDVCIDIENNLFEPIYQQLKIIYRSSLNITINGKKYIKPKPLINLTMLPEEYIALNYDFFDIYNNNDKIKNKYKLREEIIYTSQAITQNLKEIIYKIIENYEVEIL